jgi:hypothetical protein
MHNLIKLFDSPSRLGELKRNVDEKTNPNPNLQKNVEKGTRKWFDYV